MLIIFCFNRFKKSFKVKLIFWKNFSFDAIILNLLKSPILLKLFF